MAELKNIIISTLLFLAIFSGMFYSFNQWYLSTPGSVAYLDNSTVFSHGRSITYYSTYLQNWGNQTAQLMATAQSVPYLGGAFMVTVGLFQGLVLATGIIPNVIQPLFLDVANYLSLPVWFIGFAIAALIIAGVVAIANAMKGGAI